MIVGLTALSKRRVLAIEDGVGRSTQSWREVLLRLTIRGLNAPQLAIGDGAIGVWVAMDEVYPAARQQRCRQHQTINVLNCLPKLFQTKAHNAIHNIWQAETKDDAKNWAGGLIEYSFSRKFSVYISDLYNYGNENKQDRIHYYNLGGSFRKGKTKLSLNYGRQRGGLICIGGVCRFVPKSNGLTFAMNLFL